MKKPLALALSALLLCGAILAPSLTTAIDAQEPSTKAAPEASLWPLADPELTAILDAYEAGKMATVVEKSLAALAKAPTTRFEEKRLVVISGVMQKAMYQDVMPSDLYQRVSKAYTATPNDVLGALLIDLAERKGDMEAIERLQAELGLISGWCVIGPFDNERGSGFEEDFGPETEIVDFEASYQGKADREIKWRALPVPALAGKLSLESIIKPNDEVLAYAATTIEAPEACDAELRLASDEGFRIWVNGQELANTPRSREGETTYGGHVHRLETFDQNVLRAKLRKGNNLVVVKVTEAEGDWSLSLRAKSKVALTLATPAEVATWQNRMPGPDDFEFGQAEASGVIDPAPATVAEQFIEALWESTAMASERKERVAMKVLTNLKDQYYSKFSPPDQARLLYSLAKASKSTAETSAGVDENAKREMLLAVLKLNPKHYGALMALNDHYTNTLDNVNLAESYAKQARAVAPTLAAKMATAEIMLRRGLIDAYWKDVNEIVPSEGVLFDNTILAHLAWHAAQQDRKEDLLALNTRQFEADHTALGARRYLMQEALRKGDEAAFNALATDGKRLAPLNTSIYLMQADHLAAQQGENSQTFEREALQELQAALQIAPQDDDLLKQAALMAKRVADSAQRSADFHGVTEIDGTPVGEVSEQHTRLAREYYNRALASNPGRSEIRRYLEFLDDKKPIWEERLQSDMSEFFKEELKKETDSSLVVSVPYNEMITEVNSDATSATYGHLALRIENNQGRMALRQFRIPFGGQIKIVQARVWRAADGSSEPSKIERGTITNGSLNVGDIIEATFRSYSDETGFFGDYYGAVESFQGLGGLPTAKMRRTWILPEGKEYHFYERGAVPKREERIEDGKRIVRYEMNDLPRVEDEKLSPPAEQSAPTVYVSTFKSWEKFGAWYWNLIERQVKTTPAIVEKVAELTAGLESEEAKVRAIYNFTVQKIRYNAEWEFGVHGYKPYEAGAIFDRCIGDCKDKAILIVTMLREAGIKAYPVLINLEMLRGHEDITSPGPYHFNHAIAYVEFADGSDRFVDGTTTFSAYEELPIGDAGAHVVVIKPSGGIPMQIPVFEPSANKDVLSGTLKLDAQGDVIASVINNPVGNAASTIRQVFINEGSRKEAIEAGVSRYAPGAKASNVKASVLDDLNAKVLMSYDLSLPGYAEASDGTLAVRAYLQNLDYSQTFLGYLDERKNDLILPPIDGEESSFTISAPAGYVVSNLPANVSVKNTYMEYSLTFEQVAETIVVKRWLAFTGPVVPTKDYKAFRDGLVKMAAGDRTKLTFALAK